VRLLRRTGFAARHFRAGLLIRGPKIGAVGRDKPGGVAMRMTATWFLFAVASVAMSLSSADLRSRYGEPNMERFLVRPGISFSVEYGSDHLACVARLESPRPMLAKQDLQ